MERTRNIWDRNTRRKREEISNWKYNRKTKRKIRQVDKRK
jgi:hypothetical protein